MILTKILLAVAVGGWIVISLLFMGQHPYAIAKKVMKNPFVQLALFLSAVMYYMESNILGAIEKLQ